MGGGGGGEGEIKILETMICAERNTDELVVQLIAYPDRRIDTVCYIRRSETQTKTQTARLTTVEERLTDRYPINMLTGRQTDRQINSVLTNCLTGQTHRHTDTKTHTHTRAGTCRHVQTRTDTYRHVQTHTDTYRHIQTHTDTYRHIQTHTDTYRHI